MKPLRFLIAIVALSFGIGPGGIAAAETRIALVIGNSQYQNAEQLINPENDAQAVAAALQRLGFEVDLRTNIDRPTLQDAFRDFGLKAEAADVALVYYGGHGIQVAGENYLLPTDAVLERERDLIYEALPLTVVLGEVAQARRLGLVILDACRDNPLAERLRRALGPIRSRLVGSGLARVDNLPSDTMVAFSTKPGEVAVDGEREHSPYAQALLQHIEAPGVELNLLFRKVRDTVLDLTAQRQEPRTYDALGAEPFYFKEATPNRRPEIAALEPFEVLDDADVTDLGLPEPTDPDGDPMTAQVTGLPRSGVIEVGDREVLIGDVLTIQQLTAATYRPAGDFAGEAGSFDFLIKDDRGGTTFAKLPIHIEASKPPVIAMPQHLRLPSIPLNITPPVDAEGGPLTFTVEAVPERGTITSGGEAIEVGDSLRPEEIAALVLEPGADGAAGTFALKVTNSRGASVTSEMQVYVPGLGAPETAVAATAPQATVPDMVVADPAGEPVPDTAAAPPALAVEPPEAVEAPPETAPAPVEPPLETAGAVEPSGGEPYRTLRTSNIRSGPNAQTARVTTVPAGTTLLVTGRAGGRNWLEVETEDGLEGYIYAELVEPAPAGEDESPQPPSSTAAALPEPEPEPAEPPATAEPERRTAQLTAPRALTGGLRDCPHCPELVKIEGGSFVMGSEFGHHSERPERRVPVQPFALGKYEVTVGEYEKCVDAGGCRPQPDLGAVNAETPIYDLSWSDAQDYVAWLRQETGQSYRLPTEAEWEYAARAGSKTRFWWGDEVGDGRANCQNCGGEWDRSKPADVGSYEPNPLGVHDLHGGVMEWVADCWFRDYQGAPVDGSARSQPNCLQRVLRGGSWQNDQTYATSTSRLGYDFDVRYVTNGFRVARDLN